MNQTQKEMYNFLSTHISKGDLYAAKAIAQISAAIIKKRNALGMTQAEFAKKMDVTQGMISKWESADYNFTIENIAHIAEKLNLAFKIDFVPENEYFGVKNESYSLPKKYKAASDIHTIYCSAA